MTRQHKVIRKIGVDAIKQLARDSDDKIVRPMDIAKKAARMDSLRLLATPAHLQAERTASDLEPSVNRKQTQQTVRFPDLTNSYAEAWNQVRNLGSKQNAEAKVEGSSQFLGTILGPLIGTLIGGAVGESQDGSYHESLNPARSGRSKVDTLKSQLAEVELEIKRLVQTMEEKRSAEADVKDRIEDSKEADADRIEQSLAKAADAYGNTLQAVNILY